MSGYAYGFQLLLDWCAMARQS